MTICRSIVATTALLLAGLVASDASACHRGGYYRASCYVPCESSCVVHCKCDCIVNKMNKTLKVVIVADNWTFATWLQPGCKLTFPVCPPTKTWAFAAYDQDGKLVDHAEQIPVLLQDCCSANSCIWIDGAMTAARQRQ